MPTLLYQNSELVQNLGYQDSNQSLNQSSSQISNQKPNINNAELIAVWQQKMQQVKNLYTQNSAQKLISELIATNQKRKEVVKVAVEEIDHCLAEMIDGGKNSLEITKSGKNLRFYFKDKLIWIEGYWNKGIVGLIASRLCNKYNTVTVVLSLNSEND
jgi:single-stranded DNA-specific DHH superfamily exonuclease